MDIGPPRRTGALRRRGRAGSGRRLTPRAREAGLEGAVDVRAHVHSDELERSPDRRLRWDHDPQGLAAAIQPALELEQHSQARAVEVAHTRHVHDERPGALAHPRGEALAHLGGVRDVDLADEAGYDGVARLLECQTTQLADFLSPLRLGQMTAARAPVATPASRTALGRRR